MRNSLLSLLAAIGMIGSASADIVSNSIVVNFQQNTDNYDVFGIGSGGEWGGHYAGQNYETWIININLLNAQYNGSYNGPSFSGSGYYYLTGHYIYMTNGNGDAGYLDFNTPLSKGSLVDSNLTFSMNPSTSYAYPSGDLFFPFETHKGYYGWLEINDNNFSTNTPFLNMSYAYDNTGAPIQVGSTAVYSQQSVQSVPEPSTYALCGLGALVMVMAYRRKVA